MKNFVLRFGGLLLALSLTVLSSPVLANMSSPWTPGLGLGEPAGELSDIHVVSEILQFDLRPLAVGGQGRVKALYRLDNRGDARTLPLVFVGPGLETSTITLDGQSVPARELQDLEVPETWELPANIPSISGNEINVEFLDRNLKGLEFEIALPSGTCEVSVEYTFTPSTYHPMSRVYREYQVGYSLAPGRTWASFGELEIQVLLPSGFRWTSNLDFEEQDGVLQARSQGLPADHVLISLGKIGGDPGVWSALGIGGLVSVFVALLMFARGRAVSQSSRTLKILFGLSAFMIGAASAFCGLVGGQTWAESGLDASQISRSWSYSRMMGTLFYGVLLVCMSAVLSLAAYLWGLKTGKAQ